jgi:hypothetical protein
MARFLLILLRMLRMLVTFGRILAPLILGVAKAALSDLVLALTILAKSTWEAVIRIAQEWTYRAIKNGWDTQLATQLEYFFRGVALVAFWLGWWLLANFTVILTHFLLRK